LLTVDITPKAIVTAASRTLIAQLVKDLSVADSDPVELKSRRLRARRRIIAQAELLKTKDRFGLTASALVIVDLIDQGWSIKINRGGRIIARRPFDDEEIRVQKRRRYQTARDAQLRQPPTRAFIQQMEKGALTSGGRYSIFSIIRDGRDLQQEIASSLSANSGKKLSDIVQPYIQFVSTNAKCAITGFLLQDIWRYFRHTWSNPYESVPGRSMLFLVRDKAAPNHAVMGIGAISSAAVQLEARDRSIGWLGEDVLAEFERNPKPEYAQWAFKTVDKALGDIYRQDFLERGILPARLPKAIPDAVMVKLEKLAAKARDQHFTRAEARLNKPPGNASKVTATEWEKFARTSLFTFKRAREIASLLKLRNTLREACGNVSKKQRLSAMLASAKGRTALQKVVRLSRSMTVGTEIADLTVCGAVPPYNAILGGKLVAMLATSPEVVVEYKRRYHATPSIIASSMAGCATVRQANLAFIGTTSLYGERPNQYDRASYPCEIAGGPKGEFVRYRYLTALDRTRTAGVGTFQFGRDTKFAIEEFMSSTSNGQRVNNVFGEGTSPKLRSLRDGLNALGMNPDQMLQHGIEKVVYGVALVSNGWRYLLRFDEEPQYLFSLSDAPAASARIAQYWFDRWAAERMKRSDIADKLARHTLARPIRHGARVVLPSDDVDQLEFRMD
jgi:hypothetical protein